jgi:hypothetical protein
VKLPFLEGSIAAIDVPFPGYPKCLDLIFIYLPDLMISTGNLIGELYWELIEELLCFRAAADLEILKYYFESLIVPKFLLYSFLSRQFAFFLLKSQKIQNRQPR